MITKIVLEDKGQDLLWLRVNEGGLVIEAGPFQNEIWKNSYIPVWFVRVGQLCPIHSYPHIIRGFLQYKVVSIHKERRKNKQ